MADAFWAFSLAFYGRPGVSEACIALQDQYAADVDVVLFALWCASRGHALDDAEIAAVDGAVADWRNAVVQPVRAARRALKPAPGGFDAAAAGALRKSLLANELEAERLQQGAMEALAPSPGTTEAGDAARANLAAVARFGAIPPEAEPLRVLLRAFAAAPQAGAG